MRRWHSEIVLMEARMELARADHNRWRDLFWSQRRNLRRPHPRRRRRVSQDKALVPADVERERGRQLRKLLEAQRRPAKTDETTREYGPSTRHRFRETGKYRTNTI